MNAKPRRRNARAVANDTAIANAAVSEILRVGVDRVSLREVAQRAGLTHGATYARFEDVSELLVEVWQSKLSSSALELLELSRRAVEEPSEASVGLLLDRVREPRPESIAMAELLMVARRKPILYEEAEVFVKKHIRPEDGLTDESKTLVDRSLCLFGLAMVGIFEVHYFSDDQSHLDTLGRALVAALQNDPAIVIAGEMESISEELAPPDESDENLRERLVYATYVVVAKTGYHEATISRIARRANCSPGAIYKLYRSKHELILDSFRMNFRPATGLVPLANSPALADVPFRSANLRSGHRILFALETIIAAAHTDILRTTVGAYLSDPGAQIPPLAELDAVEISKMGARVRSLAALDHATQWMSAVMSFDTPDFKEFSEFFRAALLIE